MCIIAAWIYITCDMKLAQISHISHADLYSYLLLFLRIGASLGVVSVKHMSANLRQLEHIFNSTLNDISNFLDGGAEVGFCLMYRFLIHALHKYWVASVGYCILTALLTNITVSPKLGCIATVNNWLVHFLFSIIEFPCPMAVPLLLLHPFQYTC